MTWAPLLLADPSPCLRLQVLRRLLGRTNDDPEVMQLEALQEEDPLVQRLLVLQQPDGSWDQVDTAWRSPLGPIRSTSLALERLGYLGFDAEHPAVAGGAAYLFAEQRSDGSWPMPQSREVDGSDEHREGYSIVSLQTSLPLIGLATCGYAADPRSERAYEWLLAQRLPDGAWPTGIASGNYGRVAGYRRLAHSRWGCRSNTTAALCCLSLHPERRHGEAARRGLDLLLGRETREARVMGSHLARVLGAEQARGFFTYYARFDLAVVLALCARIGATRSDARVASLVDFVLDQQGEYGLWTYEERPQVSRWLTLDLLQSLAGVDERGDWISMEPRTPFQAYSRREYRY